MTEMEIKSLKVKLDLYKEISQHTHQISYHIKDGAEKVIALIRFKEPAKDGSVTISKDEYTRLFNYLMSVKNDAMHNFDNNKYLEDYYTSIRIKQEILNKL
jgi:hypothetical protein